MEWGGKFRSQGLSLRDSDLGFSRSKIESSNLCFLYLFIYWAAWVSVVSLGIFSCGSSSLTRDGTHIPYIGSEKCWPLDYQGSPQESMFLMSVICCFDCQSLRKIELLYIICVIRYCIY